MRALRVRQQNPAAIHGGQCKPQVLGRFDAGSSEPRQVPENLHTTVSGPESAAIAVAINIMYSSSGVRGTRYGVSSITHLRAAANVDGEHNFKKEVV
jgi:hypothetical protein